MDLYPQFWLEVDFQSQVNIFQEMKFFNITEKWWIERIAENPENPENPGCSQTPSSQTPSLPPTCPAPSLLALSELPYWIWPPCGIITVSLFVLFFFFNGKQYNSQSKKMSWNGLFTAIAILFDILICILNHFCLLLTPSVLHVHWFIPHQSHMMHNVDHSRRLSQGAEHSPCVIPPLYFLPSLSPTPYHLLARRVDTAAQRLISLTNLSVMSLDQDCLSPTTVYVHFCHMVFHHMWAQNMFSQSFTLSGFFSASIGIILCLHS